MHKKPMTDEDIAMLKMCAASLPIFPVCDVQGNPITTKINGVDTWELQKPFRRLKKALIRGKLNEEIRTYDLEYKIFLKKQAELMAGRITRRPRNLS